MAIAKTEPRTTHFFARFGIFRCCDNKKGHSTQEGQHLF